MFVFHAQTQNDTPIVSFHGNICLFSVPPLLRRLPGIIVTRGTVERHLEKCKSDRGFDCLRVVYLLEKEGGAVWFVCVFGGGAEGCQGWVAAVVSKGLNKDHHIFMHLLLLTYEKCQLSCFYFGVFALFIWFISAWALLALTAARPVLPAPEFFRLI